MSHLKTQVILVAVGIVAALAGALLAHRILQGGSTPLSLTSGTVLEPPRATPEFALTDQDGVRFDRARLNDRWTFMFFGFTHCGDVCPTTLALLATAKKSLDDLPETLRPQVIFVSVDARRDSPEVVKNYVNNFNPAFIGVTGEQRNLDAFTSALGIPSAIRELENGGYAVDHSASIIAFNPNGEMRALFSPPHTIAALVSDYRTLVGAK